MKNVEAVLGKRRVHPFAARMAVSIPYFELMRHHRQLQVLDPMAGSGTTIAIARRLGHRAFGLDSDPLAILMARVACESVDHSRTLAQGDRVLATAKRLLRFIGNEDAYPVRCDAETRAYIDYWFDCRNRRQLAALVRAIDATQHGSLRRLFHCAVSRMIVVKSVGASRAMDVAHSRPHRVYSYAPIRPLDRFVDNVKSIIQAIPFHRGEALPPVTIRRGDARRLPFEDRTMDLIITSPPYLRAIDYLRGHRLSLVWLGYRVSEIRAIGSRAVGCERSSDGSVSDRMVNAFNAVGVNPQIRGTINRYCSDLRCIFDACRRVLKHRGRMIVVVADSTLAGRRITTARGVELLAREAGFELISRKSRRIPADRRYLPPPSQECTAPLDKRMRSEAVLEFTV